MWSIDKAAHRVIGKGQDKLGLGCWTWVRYQGKDNIMLCIFTAYRPNPPSEGPFTVYAQHWTYFNTIDDDRCPREAFITGLVIAIQESLQEGDNIIVMLDGNEDMRSGALSNAFHTCTLREVILEKHGPNTPSTYDRNTKNTPIDGIWCTPSLQIQVGG